jgi:dolichol-phosphate mannosyltransferase
VSLRDGHNSHASDSRNDASAPAPTLAREPATERRARPRRSSATSLTLVVPTRNEAENVRPFVERVRAALEPYPIEWYAEIVDSSDDDTTTRLRRLAKRGAPLKITRQSEVTKAGLGRAIRAGLADARGDVVCVIDADLQHPPEILPDLLAPIVLGRADISVGSRYSTGGSAAGLETRWRRLAARGARIAVRRVLPATRLTTDPGSGLFAMRRELLETMEFHATGPRVLAEILTRAEWHTICDVPYKFVVTDDENTELGLADGIAATRELLGLYRWRPAAATRGEDPSKPQRRVAPVHAELMRV